MELRSGFVNYPSYMHSTIQVITDNNIFPSWWWWDKYFEPFESDDLNKDLLENSFAVHYWNHCRTYRSMHNRCVTGRRETQREYLLDPDHLLYRIFKANCPVTQKNLLRNLIGHPY